MFDPSTRYALAAALSVLSACSAPTSGTETPNAGVTAETTSAATAQSSAVGDAREPAATASSDGAAASPRGATCADKKRCAADAPICAVVSGKPRCVAAGSKDLAASKGQYFQCTLHADCAPEEACYTPPDQEGDVPAAACIGGEQLQGFAAATLCDASEKPCSPKDPECMPCKSDGVPGLTWIGHQAAP